MYTIEKLETKTFKLSGPGIDSLICDSFEEASRIRTVCEHLRKFYEDKIHIAIREVFDHSSVLYFYDKNKLK